MNENKIYLKLLEKIEKLTKTVNNFNFDTDDPGYSPAQVDEFLDLISKYLLIIKTDASNLFNHIFLLKKQIVHLTQQHQLLIKTREKELSLFHELIRKESENIDLVQRVSKVEDSINKIKNKNNFKK